MSYKYQYKKALLVGAGGIGCHLAPMLCRLMDLVIMDGDNYEPKNVTRQFPALKSTENKAKALCEQLGSSILHKLTPREEYLKGPAQAADGSFDDIEIIFSAVDNNKSRLICIELADSLGIPAILAGNEEFDAEAILFIPDKLDPRDHFPFKLGTPAPFDCNSDETIESAPQTVIANIMAAGASMQILLSLQKVKNYKNTLAFVKHDVHGSRTYRIRDVEAGALNQEYETTTP